ncbi:endonuclease domain-containing protein [Acinetobacter faecalis]|uniref:endonuclease domain-containing protein n=1 Tax=Acinetobacter faecalis TaxID=2665161 RepID=UPI002A915D5C|nr:endonuclease domain-containing protein [Acinetobacter faecalis]MDY6450626.1 endonuclease domain-containing protein [Acinetobacter faecalis]
MQKIFNKVEYKERRKMLRNNMTEPEKRLWLVLKNKQLGLKFRRQHGIGDYIVDFYSPEIKLVIELDGESHFSTEAKAYDQLRDEYFLGLGISTIRFLNQDVMNNLAGVFQTIQNYIRQDACKSE